MEIKLTDSNVFLFILQRRFLSTKVLQCSLKLRDIRWCEQSSGWMKLWKELHTSPRLRLWTNIAVISVFMEVRA